MVGIIVARDRNGCIGKNGKIPWKIKGEQKQFRELTTGNAVIMGRKSYEEIGHPLPNRLNIVVSRSTFEGENLKCAKSLSEAIEIAKREGYENIYIAGGYGLFKEGLPLADKMYITNVDTEVEGGDTFFPDFDEEEYEVTIGETGGEDIKFTRVTYEKIREKELESYEEKER